MKKIWLSYSSLTAYEKSPHSWLNNKVYGIKQPETIYMTEGKAAHKVFQDHVTDKVKDSRITVDLTFPQAEYQAWGQWNDKYGLYGYIDLINFASKTICEYKTSSTPWSQQRFDELKQIPFYAICTNFRKIFMVTSTRDLKNFKTFYKEVTEKEIEATKKWIVGLVKRINKGDFTSDLVNGKCKGCDYKELCYYV